MIEDDKAYLDRLALYGQEFLEAELERRRERRKILDSLLTKRVANPLIGEPNPTPEVRHG